MSGKCTSCVRVLPCGTKHAPRFDTRTLDPDSSPASDSSAPTGSSRSAGILRRLISGLEGFTLVEAVVTISLLSILMAMFTGALSYYFSGKSLETSAREITSEIQEAQALALATGNTYRIDLTATGSYTLQRRQGAEWINVRGPMSLEGGITFSSAPSPDFGGDRYIECYARGTCEDGSLVLNDRFGSNKVVQLEGETVNINVS